MALKIILHVLKPLRRQKKEAADSQQKAAPIMMADGKADVVTDHGAGGGDEHYQGDVEVAGRSEVSGDQQNCFAGHWKSGVLEHHAEEDGPVTVSEHVLLDQLERIVQEIHLSGQGMNDSGVDCQAGFSILSEGNNHGKLGESAK